VTMLHVLRPIDVKIPIRYSISLIGSAYILKERDNEELDGLDDHDGVGVHGM